MQSVPGVLRRSQPVQSVIGKRLVAVAVAIVVNPKDISVVAAGGVIADVKVYQSDAAGNMTYDTTAALSYSFDQENRLTGAAGYTYYL